MKLLLFNHKLLLLLLLWVVAALANWTPDAATFREGGDEANPKAVSIPMSKYCQSFQKITEGEDQFCMKRLIILPRKCSFSCSGRNKIRIKNCSVYMFQKKAYPECKDIYCAPKTNGLGTATKPTAELQQTFTQTTTKTTTELSTESTKEASSSEASLTIASESTTPQPDLRESNSTEPSIFSLSDSTEDNTCSSWESPFDSSSTESSQPAEDSSPESTEESTSSSGESTSDASSTEITRSTDESASSASPETSFSEPSTSSTTESIEENSFSSWESTSDSSSTKILEQPEESSSLSPSGTNFHSSDAAESIGTEPILVFSDSSYQDISILTTIIGSDSTAWTRTSENPITDRTTDSSSTPYCRIVCD